MSLIEIARWGVASGTVSVMTEGISQVSLEAIQMMLPRVESRVINVM